jgi:hypothetical protein
MQQYDVLETDHGGDSVIELLIQSLKSIKICQLQLLGEQVGKNPDFVQ